MLMVYVELTSYYLLSSSTRLCQCITHHVMDIYHILCGSGIWSAIF